jgi:hypothetical protein
VFVQKDRLTQHVSKHHADVGAAGGEGGGAPAAAAPPPAAAPAAPAAPIRVTHKTPKTILQEFLQKAKRVQPRYVPKEAPGGSGWICKARGRRNARALNAVRAHLPRTHTPARVRRSARQVVLPDKYKPDSDVVMWMEDVAPDKDEATQRAAVVALARVATNLPLQRLLARCGAALALVRAPLRAASAGAHRLTRSCVLRMCALFARRSPLCLRFRQ